jgi:hypothetical protein
VFRRGTTVAAGASSGQQGVLHNSEIAGLCSALRRICRRELIRGEDRDLLMIGCCGVLLLYAYFSLMRCHIASYGA